MNISKSEHHVLQALWDESPLTVGQIVERVQSKSDWHENTIKTLLVRLVGKKAVRRRKDGKRFFYEPLVTKEAVVDTEAAGLLRRFFDGQMPALIAHFAEQKMLSRRDIEEMEAILKRLKKDAR
jgi:BlaI family transcriptional regulator, penicillinase repressor